MLLKIVYAFQHGEKTDVKEVDFKCVSAGKVGISGLIGYNRSFSQLRFKNIKHIRDSATNEDISKTKLKLLIKQNLLSDF